MAAKIKAWLVHGGIAHSGWCEYHNLPHLFTYEPYRLTEHGVEFLKSVKQCDMR